VGDLVTLSLEKILGEKINGKEDEELIKKIVKNLK
jgi:F0F1-type ATP synthase membrane subunit b/b'